jgi:DNA repair protein RadC
VQDDRSDRRSLYLLTGRVGETVSELSQRLLAHHGGLRDLLRLDVAELALGDFCFRKRPAL